MIDVNELNEDTPRDDDRCECGHLREDHLGKAEDGATVECSTFLCECEFFESDGSNVSDRPWLSTRELMDQSGLSFRQLDYMVSERIFPAHGVRRETASAQPVEDADAGPGTFRRWHPESPWVCKAIRIARDLGAAGDMIRHIANLIVDDPEDLPPRTGYILVNRTRLEVYEDLSDIWSGGLLDEGGAMLIPYTIEELA